jgi:hypothetical protein
MAKDLKKGEPWEQYVWKVDDKVSPKIDRRPTDGSYFPAKSHHGEKKVLFGQRALDCQSMKNEFQHMLHLGHDPHYAMEHVGMKIHEANDDGKCCTRGETNYTQADKKKCGEHWLDKNKGHMRWTVYTLKHDGRMAVLFDEKQRRFGCVRGWSSTHKRKQEFYNPKWDFFEEHNSRVVERQGVFQL